MEQNISFINQPLSPSIIGMRQMPNKKYCYYRIPYLGADSQVQKQKISRIKSALKNEEINSSNIWANKKTPKRIRSQAICRNDNDCLPTIKKKEYGSKNFALIKRGQSYLPGHRANHVINNPPKIRSISNNRQNSTKDLIKDYLKQLKKKQQIYENKRYKLTNQARSVISSKQAIKQEIISNISRVNECKSQETTRQLVKIFNVKTQYHKERITFHQIYFSFKKQNASKDKFYKKVPKIPIKDQFQFFLANYVPSNDQIDLKSLLNANFCVIEHSPRQIYIGQMIGKHKHGIGILITQKTCFEGEWRNNQKVKGVEVNTNGVYKGTYFDNKRHGKGYFQRHSGQTYVGEWVNGKKHGEGLWANNQGQSYKGQWKFGKADGLGILKLKQRTYQGVFVDFRQEGFGRQTFKKGDSFQGIFKNDLPYGEATYKWKNGSKYIGSFVCGKREGYGEMYYKDIVLYKGNYKKDKPEGQCQVHLIDREKQNYKVNENQKVILIKSPIF